MQQPRGASGLRTFLGGQGGDAHGEKGRGAEDQKKGGEAQVRPGHPAVHHSQVLEDLGALPEGVLQGQAGEHHLPQGNGQLGGEIGGVDRGEVAFQGVLGGGGVHQGHGEDQARGGIGEHVPHQPGGAAGEPQGEAQLSRALEGEPAPEGAAQAQGEDVGAPGAEAAVGKKGRLEQQGDTGQGGADEGPEQDGDERRPARVGARAGKGRQGDEGGEKDEGATHADQGLFVREAGSKLLHAPGPQTHEGKPGNGISGGRRPGDDPLADVHGCSPGQV